LTLQASPLVGAASTLILLVMTGFALFAESLRRRVG
jgi:hypothetical protein